MKPAGSYQRFEVPCQKLFLGNITRLPELPTFYRVEQKVFSGSMWEDHLLNNTAVAVWGKGFGLDFHQSCKCSFQ
jgi:hypothetical protein